MANRDLWNELCSYENLELAYRKARRHKTLKPYVIEFEKNLKGNLLLLRTELLLHSYSPIPLVNFTIYDPKLRKISKSDFRDRIVHHALCNIIEPIFDKSFIYDSYANRKGKGTLGAIKRFDFFKRKVSRNNTLDCYVLKADIRKYFDNIDRNILLNFIKRKISDHRILWLIRKILDNTTGGGGGRFNLGMPLGNLTSQFFANVYLNELDQFVKHKLKVKYYIRYVDDFVILDNNKDNLERCKLQINEFLRKSLQIELHPEKSKILLLNRGISLLGLRVYYYHRLLKKSNLRRFNKRFGELRELYYDGTMTYDEVYGVFLGWLAYAKHASTFKQRKRICKQIEESFPNQIPSFEIERLLRKAGKN